jgi:potassium efflux system protein
MSVARYRTGIFAAAAWLLCGLALAQVPGIAGLGASAPRTETATPAAGSQVTDTATKVAELGERLASERKLLEMLDGPDGMSAGAPPGTEVRLLQQRHIRVAYLVRTLVQYMADLEKLDETRKRHVAVEKEVGAWTGLSEKPPYSILLADRLRAEHQAARVELEGLSGRKELLKQTSDEMRERLKLAQQELRQITEKAERMRAEADQRQIAWERESASLLVRVTETVVSQQETMRQLLDEQIAIAQLDLDLAERKRDQAATATQFSEEDMAQVRTALSTERDTLLIEVDRMAREFAQLQLAAREARKASESLRTTGGHSGESEAQYLARLYRLEQDADLKQARADTANALIERRREVIDTLRIRGVLWEARFTGHQKQDARSRQQARETAEKFLDFMAAQKKQFEQMLNRANNRVIEIEARMENSELPAQNSHLREMQKSYGERAIGIQRTLAALDASLTLAQQTLVEYGGGSHSQRSLTERRQDWKVSATTYATAFWNFELLAIEDTIEVDGKQIVGMRSVTVGKILSALLLIAIGYALAVLIARFGERMLIRHFGWQPTHAAILRRWLLAAELVILIIIALAWVKIPLTAFAFLGGAIAIGLGFGMQTLLKNLISGLMVLGEQPFRIGDLVEVGSVRGNVTNIGLRASTITDVNGIETIIPNSTFVEQNLTNWTLTTGRVRFNVKVGVAYGSAVRTVTQLLEEIAGRHGKVLKQPAPEVLFEDFASDALIFAVYYWLDVGAGSISRQVASDLRAMIEGSFTAKGIVIAYPQRDVHLDVTAPLPVRVVPDTAPAKSEQQQTETA